MSERPRASRARSPRNAAPSDDAGRPERVSTPEQERERLLLYAFRALGQRALSRHELHERLLRRTEQPEIAEAVLARVQELGYLSDEQVAHSEAARRGVGQHRVRQKLRQRGVDAGVVAQVMAERDPDAEEEDARTLLDRRWDSFQRSGDPVKRAHAFLMRRGYPGSLIWRLLREKAAEVPDELDAEEDEP
ncbi:RecX family transcriptional regulator [Deinococcus sp. KNUC1210]|uniref:RecX family transcriptional regulator n=1 Tax=Deinococcus sp. KNUC1210 TaxID=2917691 RepID=UPI001EEFF428|nr:RecX family transcriptional regulator [Deinococcus sp. KNUC1210]ULH16231.1 RecX family transcriptional regulator [Deinococcus sp. KNUC1210]